VTAGDWTPFGGDPAPGDPQAAGVVATIFGDVAATGSHALAALHGLARHADGSIWRGPAADAFGIHLAQTPGQLQKMVTSYETASQAMRGFSTALAGWQERAAALLPRLQDAQQTVASAQAARAAVPAGHPATAEDARVTQAHGQLAALLGDVDHIRGECQAAAARCRAGLEQSHVEGIQNESWWQHALDDLSSVLGEVVKWAGVVLVVIAIVVLIAAFPEITGPLLIFLADAGEALLTGLAAAGEAFGGVALDAAGEAVAEAGATEVAGTETAVVTGAGVDSGLAGTEVGDFSVSETGEVEESFTEVGKTSSTGARLAEQWKTLGENNWWKGAGWAMRGLAGLKTAADADRYFQDGEPESGGDLIGDSLDDVFGLTDVVGETSFGSRIGMVQKFGTETEATSTLTNIYGADGGLAAIKASFKLEVTPNAVEVNLGTFTDPVVRLANASGHGTESLGKLISEAFGGHESEGVTHHVDLRGAG
jgi:hypothetical protein